jgi:hypothetical protein
VTEVADLCVETSITMGVGTISLQGAVPGFFSFRESFADGAVVFYAQRQKGGSREVCKGTLHYGTPDTLTRDSVYRSNIAGNAPVNWAGDQRMVYSCLPAGQVLLMENALSEIADFLIAGNDLSEISALGGSHPDNALGHLGATALGKALVKAASQAAAIAALGLANSATIAAGTAAGNLALLAGASQLSALDLSLATALPAFYSGALIQLFTGGSNSTICRFSSYAAGVLTVAAANGITGSFTPDTPAQLSALWARGSDGKLYPPQSIVPFTGAAANSVYYLGNAGALTAPPSVGPPQVGPSSFNTYVRVGHGLATNVLWFDPRPPMVANAGGGLALKLEGNYLTA